MIWAFRSIAFLSFFVDEAIFFCRSLCLLSNYFALSFVNIASSIAFLASLSARVLSHYLNIYILLLLSVHADFLVLDMNSHTWIHTQNSWIGSERFFSGINYCEHFFFNGHIILIFKNQWSTIRDRSHILFQKYLGP